MNIIKKIIISYLTVYGNSTVKYNNDFIERKVMTKTEIIKNNKFECTEKYIIFLKELKMSQYKTTWDNTEVTCESIYDINGNFFTKIYYKLLI